MSIEIQNKENEVNEIDIAIHNSLNDIIDKLYFIASNEVELNKICLKKYENVKYGYSKEILKQQIPEKNIENIFKETFDDIESICSSTYQKENRIKEIQASLNSSLN